MLKFLTKRGSKGGKQLEFDDVFGGGLQGNFDDCIKNKSFIKYENDTLGEIVAWDEKNSRWKVKLDYDGSTKALQLKNLTKQSGGGSCDHSRERRAAEGERRDGSGGETAEEL